MYLRKSSNNIMFLNNIKIVIYEDQIIQLFDCPSKPLERFIVHHKHIITF